MKINKNSLVLAAAFTGLLGSTMARVNAAPASGSSLSAVLQAADDTDKKDIEKHACKGLNSCKGNGGGDKKEWGKKECKGKGACATGGSKKWRFEQEGASQRDRPLFLNQHACLSLQRVHGLRDRNRPPHPSLQ